MQQLVALIRSSLWNKAADGRLFSRGPIDWHAIERDAFRLGVGSLALHGALTLPADMLPPKAWQLRAWGYIARNRRMHELVEACTAEAVACLKDAGIRAVLLKGAAYAALYPDPSLRQSGDVDLFVGEADYALAFETARKHGWQICEEYRPDDKHFCCVLRGITIEIHRFALQPPLNKANRLFQLWSWKQLYESWRDIRIDSQEVPLPTPMFDLVFAFAHMYLHFLSDGIGLKQVCDWTLLMHSLAGEVDCQELEMLLTDFHLLEAWKMFAPIAVEELGLPAEECPFYSTGGHRKTNQIRKLIFGEGNFARKAAGDAKRPRTIIFRKIHTLLGLTRFLLKRVSIDPGNVAALMVWYTRSAVKRL